MTRASDVGGTGTLYPKLMGDTFDALPSAVQTLHRGGQFIGQARVTRGRNPLAGIIATLFGFPKTGEHTLTVCITTDDEGREQWLRTYSGQTMFNRQYAGRGRAAGRLIEQFGPIAVQLTLVQDGATFRYITRGWSIFGVPLPRGLAPSGDVYETVDAHARFTFHVTVIVPIIGQLVHYEGWLVPKVPTPGPDDDHRHSP